VHAVIISGIVRSTSRKLFGIDNLSAFLYTKQMITASKSGHFVCVTHMLIKQQVLECLHDEYSCVLLEVIVW